MLKLTYKYKNDGSFEIYIPNIRKFDHNLSYCIRLIEHFIEEREIFVGCYRIDGVNLEPIECQKYTSEVPKYFIENGRYLEIDDIYYKRSKPVIMNGMMKVASAFPGKEFYNIIPLIFNYHLNTIIMNPTVPWDKYVERFKSFHRSGTKNYIKDGLTKFLFSYVDSGDFILEFDPNIYQPKSVLDFVYSILT